MGFENVKGKSSWQITFKLLSTRQRSHRWTKVILQWLQQLQARTAAKISKASTTEKHDQTRADRSLQHSSDSEEAEDVELVGWRTRLINRLGQGRPSTSTIPAPATPAGSQVTNLSNPAALPVTPGGKRLSGGWDGAVLFPDSTPDPTDALVRRLRQSRKFQAKVPFTAS